MSKEEAETYAKKLGLVYIEVSAKTAQNVNLAFEMITEKILEKIENREISINSQKPNSGRRKKRKTAHSSLKLIKIQIKSPKDYLLNPQNPL